MRDMSNIRFLASQQPPVIIRTPRGGTRAYYRSRSTRQTLLCLALAVALCAFGAGITVLALDTLFTPKGCYAAFDNFERGVMLLGRLVP